MLLSHYEVLVEFCLEEITERRRGSGQVCEVFTKNAGPTRSASRRHFPNTRELRNRREKVRPAAVFGPRGMTQFTTGYYARERDKRATPNREQHLVTSIALFAAKTPDTFHILIASSIFGVPPFILRAFISLSASFCLFFYCPHKRKRQRHVTD